MLLKLFDELGQKIIYEMFNNLFFQVQWESLYSSSLPFQENKKITFRNSDIKLCRRKYLHFLYPEQRNKKELLLSM